jgi:hypothetical protein
MKRVLLKTLQPAVVMMALCAACIAFSLGAYAMPISAPAALGGTSDQINLAEAVHCGYYYGCGYYRPYVFYRPYGYYRPYVFYRPYGYYRPYYRQYGYYRAYRYRPYFSYPYRLPPPVH